MSGPSPDRRMLLVGGSGGLVGRALLAEFAGDWSLRSVHRHEVPAETSRGVPWRPLPIGPETRWQGLVTEGDTVVNVAWYRTGGERKFAELTQGLLSLIETARSVGVERFVHFSVPDAPERMERDLPYLAHKRELDRALAASGLSYLILRPTLLYGPGDRLLTVMLRLMHRYRRFPMFGTGDYHVSPLASSDLARIVRHELARPGSRNLVLGGPQRWRYRELTDRMFSALGRVPRYVHLSPRSARVAASILERAGSQLICEYEVDWLMSDMLGPPAYPALSPPLRPVETFLDAEAVRLRGRAAPAT